MTETIAIPETQGKAKPSLFAKAVAGILDGVADARKSVGNTFSTLGQWSTKAVYGTCYGISYGVTLTALGIAMILPETMLLGFKEGAEAAEETIAHRCSESPSEASEQPA